MLHHAGYRTGLYTSPHLHCFTERIRIDGVPISEEDVVSLVGEICASGSGIPATFFEFTTAMALLHFKRQQVDVAILEVGMGGRLDATNAVCPDLSIITPISLDHAEHLGGDLASIAREKGGILKRHVPAIIGRQPAEALHPLLKQAWPLEAPVSLSGRDFTIAGAPEGVSFHGLGEDLDALTAGLAGRHQHDNLSLSVAASLLLRKQGLRISDAALRAGLSAVRWPGRLEWWGGSREILLDGAHNSGGASCLADYLASEGIDRVRWVVGVKGPRDPREILAPILPRTSMLYCVEPPVEEPVPAASVAKVAQESGIAATIASCPSAALKAARQDREPGEIVLVAGSLFLIAEIRQALLQEQERAA